MSGRPGNAAAALSGISASVGLKNVIFGEPTISMKESVLKEAIAARREEFGAG